MATRVVYIPGILGSSLGWQVGAVEAVHPCWLDLPAVLRGDLARLQLAGDGVSPGPLAEGATVRATGLLNQVYAPLAQLLSALGYSVLPLPWDWRQSHITQAQALWPVVQAWAAGQPIWIVCHSAGGILARAIYGQMLAGGQDAQLAGIIGAGVPHYGSLEPVRLWWRQPATYLAIAAASGGLLTWPPGQALLWLDAVLASMPAWYELQAFAALGPLWQQYPAQAAGIYTSAYYQGANPYLSPALWLAAQTVQTVLAGLMPFGRLWSIAGTGVPTAYALQQPGDPSTDAGWLYTQAGDGSVTVGQAVPAGFPVDLVPVPHGLQPLHPAVWARVLAHLPPP